ncbi:MAG: hypothetical protein ACFFD4_24215 [Candidatus Odinarchaeota archaeon]
MPSPTKKPVPVPPVPTDVLSILSLDFSSLTRAQLIKLLFCRALNSLSSVSIERFLVDPDLGFLDILLQLVNHIQSMNGSRRLPAANPAPSQSLTWCQFRDRVTATFAPVNRASVTVECPNCHANWNPEQGSSACPSCGSSLGGVDG